MKLTKVSLMVVVVTVGELLSNAYVADIFKNDKVHGELRAYYFGTKTETTHDNILATGSVFEAYQSYQANTKSYSGKLSYDFLNSDRETLFGGVGDSKKLSEYRFKANYKF